MKDASSFAPEPEGVIMTGQMVPVICADLELSEGLMPEKMPSESQALRLLVRLHGEPLGYVELPPTEVTEDQLLRLLENQMGRRVQEHLAKDIAGPGTAVPDAVGFHQCSDDPEDLTSVSIVVCTRDRPALLQICLRNLMSLDHDTVEVIVVDNAPSSGATRRAFDELVGSDPRFRCVTEPRPGLSRARNTGFAHCRGEVVAFTDDDAAVDPAWIAGLLRGFRRSGDVGCVTGLVATAGIDSPAEAFFDARVSWSDSFTARMYRRDDRTAGPLHPWAAGKFGTGANFALRTSVLKELGGFDECLGAGSLTMGGEDLDIFVRVLLAGYALAYEPWALVRHTHRTDLAELKEQMFAYGLGLGAYLTKHLLEPSSAVDMLRRVPGAVRHMSGVVNKPQKIEEGESFRNLRRTELRGLATGPFAYARARRSQSKLDSGRKTSAASVEKLPTS